MQQSGRSTNSEKQRLTRVGHESRGGETKRTIILPQNKVEYMAQMSSLRVEKGVRVTGIAPAGSSWW